MIRPTERHGNPCPECGGCNSYCADCTDPLLENLSAVTKAAAEVIYKGTLVPGYDASGLVKIIIPAQNWQALFDALDVSGGALSGGHGTRIRVSGGCSLHLR